SPSKAHAVTRLPAFCVTSPSGMKGGCAGKPVSSLHSRIAAASGSSGGSYSPLGKVQAPASLPRHHGPPGRARSTSSAPPRRRYINRPALVFMARSYARARSAVTRVLPGVRVLAALPLVLLDHVGQRAGRPFAGMAVTVRGLAVHALLLLHVLLIRIPVGLAAHVTKLPELQPRTSGLIACRSFVKERKLSHRTPARDRVGKFRFRPAGLPPARRRAAPRRGFPPSGAP